MASKQRVICGLSVAAVWLVAIFALPVWALAGVLAAGAVVCLYELCSMLGKAGYKLPFAGMAVWTLAWFAAMYMNFFASASCRFSPYIPLAFPGLFVIAFFGVAFTRLLNAKIEKPMESMALSLFALLYIPVMLSLFLPVVAQGGKDSRSGIFLALVLVLVTKMCDTGGYFIGSAFGKHKMCPRLSPGKSWEGTAGGYLFSLISGGIVIGLAHLFPQVGWFTRLHQLTTTVGGIVWFLVTVVVIVTVGILGDLLESLFKRQCGVKDSSALFPAMGGFFDTFDSVIFVPLTFFVMFFIREILETAW